MAKENANWRAVTSSGRDMQRAAAAPCLRVSEGHSTRRRQVLKTGWATTWAVPNNAGSGRLMLSLARHRSEGRAELTWVLRRRAELFPLHPERPPRIMIHDSAHRLPDDEVSVTCWRVASAEFVERLLGGHLLLANLHAQTVECALFRR
jgi:hypothetical protein